MTKKICLLSLSLLMIITLAGCAGKPIELDPDKVPTREEIDAFRETRTEEEYLRKMAEIRALIDATPYEEVYENIEASLTEWADGQTLLPLDHATIEFTRDIIMNEGFNYLLFSDLHAVVGLYYDPYKIDGPEYEMVDEAFDQVVEALKETLYGSFKIYDVTVLYYDTAKYGTGGSHRNDRKNSRPNTTYAEYVNDHLPADELHIQTIAFNYVKAFNEAEFGDEENIPDVGAITMRRFGIKPDTDELYIEIPIYTLGKWGETKLAAFKSSLEGRSRELFELIVSDETVSKFLTDNKVSTVTVAFNTLWETKGEFYYTYSYPLEG